MTVQRDRSVQAVLWSDFMTAVGPLRPAKVIGRRPGTTITGEPTITPDGATAPPGSCETDPS